MLVVVTTPLEDPALAGAIGEIAAAGTKSTRPGAEQKPEVLVLAPATNSAFAHWLSDLRKARFDAQRRLTLSLAALATVDVDARGTVGDSDTVQAVEDTLRGFPAQEVVFVTRRGAPSDVGEVPSSPRPPRSRARGARSGRCASAGRLGGRADGRCGLLEDELAAGGVHLHGVAVANSPSSSCRASLSISCFWITRLSGRAP